MHMIFIHLPVQDLKASRTFYEAFGFRIEEHSSDEQTASLVVNEDIVVVLRTRDRFADLVPGKVGDPSHAPTVVLSVTVDNRDDVDHWVARAVEAGGKAGLPAREEAARYTGSFTDLDGHAWEVLWMDQLHVVN